MESAKQFNTLGIKMETSDLNDELSYPYNGHEDLDILPNNEIFSRDSLFLDEEDEPPGDGEDDLPGDEDDEEEDDIIILHIDIREPIKRLKKLLEQKIAVNLTKYEFWLQDAQILEPDKNLVDQCVKGEGLVQINVQVRTASKRINWERQRKKTKTKEIDVRMLEIDVRREELKIREKEVDVKAKKMEIKNKEMEILLEKTKADSENQKKMSDLLSMLVNRN